MGVILVVIIMVVLVVVVMRIVAQVRVVLVLLLNKCSVNSRHLIVHLEKEPNWL